MIYKLKILFRTFKKLKFHSNFWSLLFVIFHSRFQKASIYLFQNKFTYNDSLSFLAMYDEIINREIYRFKSPTLSPIIIDGGSNIGLSILYFKKLYPQAKIIGFEPDPIIHEIATTNIQRYNFNDVEIIEKALWNKETNLFFSPDNSAGGHISTQKNTSLKIKAAPLRDFLIEPIDFLKLDIEGAELTVLEDCKDHLNEVKNLFVEYHSFVNQKQELYKLIQIIEQAGFRYYIEHNGFLSRKPFIRQENMNGIDCLLNIFAYRT